MSAKVQGWVWDLDLCAQRKLLLLWLANRATDAGVCFPTKRELGKRTGLSERMVRYHLEALAADRDDQGERRAPLLNIIERRVAADRNTSNVYVLCVPWAAPETVHAELRELKHIPNDPLRGVGTTGCTQGGGDDGLHPVGTTGCTQVATTGCTENRSPGDYHPESPLPPAGEQPQQQGNVRSDETEGCREDPAHIQPVDDGARELAEAFYTALGADTLAVTAAIRRRDLAIARQLVAAGATAAEAAAYARDVTAAAGRIAPVDLRSFERERLGWLARRRGRDVAERRVVDRTGQPPSWQTGQATTREEQQAPPVLDPPERAGPRPALDERNTPGVAGDQLAEKLRTVFRGGRP